jgi:D-alanine-D-alanine ligase-like ATP-grasp enzyme
MSQTVTVVSTKKPCSHCGNNPVPHLGERVGSALEIALDPFSQSFFRKGIGIFFIKTTDLFLSGVSQALLFFKIATYDTEITDDISDRGKVLMEEAKARGWYMATLRVLNKSTDAYKVVTPSGKEYFFKGLPQSSISAGVISGWIDDKAVLKKRLSSEGIAVSKGSSFSKLAEAEAYFASVDTPLIIKPRLGSRGRHTTTYITKREEFVQAFVIAKQLGHFVVVEEHLVGSVYRGTVVDGVLAGVLAGDPPRITGDGVSTIRELIETKNKYRHSRVGEVKYTDKIETFLQRHAYALDTVLEADKTIDLSEKIGLSYGGNAREITPLVHPKLSAELERAAKIIGEPILGFDFITTDVSADPDIVKWGIIECNTVPFINLHHDPLEGEPVNVAGKVLDYLTRKESK